MPRPSKRGEEHVAHVMDQERRQHQEASKQHVKAQCCGHVQPALCLLQLATPETPAYRNSFSVDSCSHHQLGCPVIIRFDPDR